MASIREVMSGDPVTMAMSSSVVEAAQAMSRSDIGDVLVVNDAGELHGILTDRDITVRVVAEQMDPTGTTVGDVCTTGLQTLSPEDSVGDAIQLMTDSAVRRLPIVENGKPVGVVSIGDLAATHDEDSALADISTAPPNN